MNHRHARVASCGALLLVPVLLAGCGVFESKRVDYKSVQKAKPLDVPPELTTPSKDERYSVAEIGSKGTTYSSYLAERSGKKTPEGEVAALLPTFDKMRIDRAGTQRWLVIDSAPDKVWPVLKQFVLSRGLQIKLESVESAIIETDWAQRNMDVTLGGIRGALARGLGTFYDTGERDKFRFRLESGQTGGTTEVFVSYRAAEEVYIDEGKADTRWQPKAVDPEREAEMIVRLMSFIGMEEKKAQAALAAGQAIGGKARVVKSDAAVLLEFDERFDRAWRRVGLVLDRNGFTVDDRDRKSGLYYVKYDDPVGDKKKAESSIWSWLAFWRDKEELVPAETKFRIHVKATGEDQSQVSVMDKEGVVLSTSTAQRILELMEKELK